MNTILTRASVLAVIATGPVAAVWAQPVRVAADDAFIEADSSTRNWTIGTRAMRFRLSVNRSGTLSTTLVPTAATGSMQVVTSPDTMFVVDGRSVSVSGASRSFTYTRSQIDAFGQGLKLTLEFSSRSDRLIVRRSYVAVPGAPAVVTWNELVTDGSAVRRVSVLSGWKVTVHGAEQLHWLTGLPDPTREIEPFAPRSQSVLSGGKMSLRSGQRSSDEMVPWLAATGPTAAFFGGVMWSGRWHMDTSFAAGRIEISTGIEQTEALLGSGQVLEGPRGFFGITEGGLAAVSASMSLLQRGLRSRSAIVPPVVYNTWFAYGSSIDETILRTEVDRAARLGVEIFVLDAGWWLGSGRGEDYTSGLGTWTSDLSKFPSGLRAFADFVRSRGMKFGLWVEPERVALTSVGRNGPALPEWLATAGGQALPGQEAAQVCFGSPAAWNWTRSWITALIDEVGVDYLKWDNNDWSECRRTDHGHGAGEGSYRHIRGLYKMLEDLRARYPDLIIENCAQGGHRLDLELGMLTDVGWMDDRTAPSSRVRHNTSGLGAAFSAGYLFAFVMPEGPDVPLAVRSRMTGTLGLGFRTDGLDEEDFSTLAREIGFYKRVRDIIQYGAVVPLTPAPPADGDPTAAWDAISVVSAAGDAIILIVENTPRRDRLLILPQHLDATSHYRLMSAEGTEMGVVEGAELMRDGLELRDSGETAAHLLILRRIE